MHKFNRNSQRKYIQQYLNTSNKESYDFSFKKFECNNVLVSNCITPYSCATEMLLNRYGKFRMVNLTLFILS